MKKLANISRRDFLRTGATGLVLLGGGCLSLNGTGHAYHPLPYAARLQIKDPSRFRMLQVTDLHFGPSDDASRQAANQQTLRTIAGLVAEAKPDVIVVTGDCWQGNQESGGEDHMREVMAMFAQWTTPWAFVWGNHDQLIDNTQGDRALADARHSLYRGAGTGGNYVVDVVDPHGKRVCQLVCLNSEGEGLGASQQAWLKKLQADTAKAGDAQPLRFAFFHIPLKQYAEIWDHHAASGIKGEACCTGDEDCSTLAVLKSLGVRACFCGHDHVNNYSGMADGVELVYGRATGAGGYGGDRVAKGGTLITINCRTGNFEWAALVAGQPAWKPRPGEQVEIPQPKKAG